MIEAFLLRKVQELNAKSNQLVVRLERVHDVLCEVMVRGIPSPTEHENTLKLDGSGSEQVVEFAATMRVR